MAEFETIHESKGPYDVPVTVYRSKRSGLRVVTANVGKLSSGLVNGFFTVATEADSDDGCPHTLEHLVFMGSDSMPFKGVLDILANRCYARGTNAWTDTDHTAYELTTAGHEGFLQVLPIYVEHILWPTITAEAFHTEVHYVSGEGEDGGVVYCEMQGRENSAEGRMFSELQKTLFAGTGYASETGGRMSDLRTLTVDTVRNYHKQYYRADNLCLIVTGDIQAADIFAALAPVEHKLASLPKPAPMERPFSSVVPEFKATVVKEVQFPDSDESVGQVFVGWRGCESRDVNTRTALTLLWAYLTETAVSPLQAAFVECEDPVCSDVSMFSLSHSVTANILCFSGVAMAKIDSVLDRMQQVFVDVAREGLNMDRMRDIVDRRMQKMLNALESSPHQTFCESLIWFFLYGDSQADLESALNMEGSLAHCGTLSEQDWLDLLTRYVTQQPYVGVVGKPSAALAESMRADEQARVAAQVERLGEAELKRRGEELEKAMEVNDQEVPRALLAKYPVPDASSIHTLKITRQEANKAMGLPFAAELLNVGSDFVQVTVYTDTATLDNDLRLWLELYKDIAFELPVRRGDQLVGYEDFVMELEANTVDHGVGVGAQGGSGSFSCGSFSALAKVSIKTHARDYARLVQWLCEVLWRTEFTAERLKVSAQRLLSTIPAQNRNGMKMAGCVLGNMHFGNTSYNPHACNHIRQAAHLTKVLAMLESDAAGVVQQMESLRAALWHPSRMHVLVVGDATKVHEPLASLSALQCNSTGASAPHDAMEWHIQRARGFRTSHIGGQAAVLPLASIETSFLVVAVNGPDNYSDPDAAALQVLLEYLSAAEGELWRTVRGKGLAYSYSLYGDIESGLVYYGLSKSSNLPAAFEVSKSVFDQFLTEDAEFDAARLEAAQSGCIFAEINRVETVSQAAAEAFLNLHCRSVSMDSLREKLAAIQKVTAADLKRVMRLYLANMFVPGASHVAMTTSASKRDECVQAFSQNGYKVTVLQEDGLEPIFA